MTLRLRLTLLYGACFVVAVAALLGITYAVFTGSQAQVTIVGGSVKAGLGPLAETKTVGTPTEGYGGGSEVTQVLHASGSGSAPPSQKQLQALQRRALKQSRRADAYANFLLRRQRAGDASSLLEISGIALGVIALLALGLGWLLAGRALRPLRTMNARARAITEESLHQRLGIDRRHDELGELAATFDALLARLEHAFDAQRRFVANASHELRTPLTLERALVEVALADSEPSVESLRRVCERVVASTEQQERLIDALLTLARSQSELGERGAVNLPATVEKLLAIRADRLAGIELRTALEPATIAGDAALIERLAANLLDNAIDHNGGSDRWIRVETLTEDERAILRVSNSGPPIPPDRVEELFEPFRRLGGERTARQDGLGLGLSIVRAIATAHGGSVEVQPLDAGGLAVEVRCTAYAGAPAATGSAAAGGDLRVSAGRRS